MAEKITKQDKENQEFSSLKKAQLSKEIEEAKKKLKEKNAIKLISPKKQSENKDSSSSKEQNINEMDDKETREVKKKEKKERIGILNNQPAIVVGIEPNPPLLKIKSGFKKKM